MRKKRINKGVFALPIVKNHANPTRFLPQRKAKNTRIRAYVVFLREKIPGPPFSGKPQSQRNVCQGNGKSVWTASVTEGEKAGRTVLCPPRRTRRAHPASQGRRMTSVVRIIPLTDIPLTPLRFLPSSTLHPPSSLWLQRAAPGFLSLFAANQYNCLSMNNLYAG